MKLAESPCASLKRLREMRLNHEFQLWLTKLLINVPVRVADRFLSFPKKVVFPQTRMMLEIYRTLEKVYALECKGGIFGKPDGNFQRLIHVAAKLLSKISEDDRYYRACIGLLFLLASEQLSKMDKSPAALKRLISTQWLPMGDPDGLDFLSDSFVEKNTLMFTEIALCEHLGNLARQNST
jgi:hypothetical protein